MQPATLNLKSAHIQNPSNKDYWVLVGVYPEYFDSLKFATKEIAEEAKKEANHVLETGEIPEGSKFALAYVNNEKMVK